MADVIGIVVGLGMIAMMHQIGRQLGAIKERLGVVVDRVEDHEARLRKGGM